MLKEIDAKGLRRYSVAVAEGLIEPGIKPLTDALYESGAHPLASCEGHALSADRKWYDWLFPTIKSGAEISSQPYVMFSASEGYARCFQRECTHHHQRKDLSYSWWLRAHFIPDRYELVWKIEPNSISIELEKARRDIRQLAMIARQAAKAGDLETDHPPKEL